MIIFIWHIGEERTPIRIKMQHLTSYCQNHPILEQTVKKKGNGGIPSLFDCPQVLVEFSNLFLMSKSVTCRT